MLNLKKSDMKLENIKFKAKTLHDGMWIEGDLKHLASGGVAIEGKHCIIEVDPSTVCQYTGLRDKNGKEVWENDELLVNHYFGRFIGAVTFEKGCFYIVSDYSKAELNKVDCISIVQCSKFDKEVKK